MSDAAFVGASRIKAVYDVSDSTLRRWADEGTVAVTRLPAGKRLYRRTDIERVLGIAAVNLSEKAKVCYARVSCSHQQADLERQIECLRQQCPRHEVISDIGSGLNYKRRGFSALLERVHAGTVGEVVVAHQDRLCRYGIELVEFLFEKTGTKLVVLDKTMDTSNASRQQELADDLLAVCNFFVAKHNGQRAAENRRKRKQASTEAASSKGEKEDEQEHVRGGEEAARRKVTKVSSVSQRATAEDAGEMVRHSALDVQSVSGESEESDNND